MSLCPYLWSLSSLTHGRHTHLMSIHTHSHIQLHSYIRTLTTSHTNLSCMCKNMHSHCRPHIVSFTDNRFTFIMNPIHIKAGPVWVWLSSRPSQNRPKPHGRTNSSLSSLLSPLSLSPSLFFVMPQTISSVRTGGHVGPITCVSETSRDGHLICCGVPPARRPLR